MPRTLNTNEGVYARKQLHSKSRVIAFSHMRRFQTALDLVAPRTTGRRILDYGCGDGTFIDTLLASECAPLEIIGAEISDQLIEDCRTRFQPRPDVQFVRIDELQSRFSRIPFDLIICMEVLEHATNPEVLLDEMHSLLSPNGLLIVSVPVETGPVLLFKQAVRIVSGWRGIGDYRWTSRYTVAEYLKSLFAGSSAHIVRPVIRPSDSHPYHCHKGFNWRWLKAKIAERFELQQVFGSPFKSVPPALSSQVWLVARKKAS
jgi:2-polyprenyl-3-methyl-5-hydroxy-6-metoxy-1,4-benzoquinol methylase